jgi:sodium-dependent dicarboxylate transporter 2/3/5
MLFKNKFFLLFLAFLIGLVVFLLPRPEGRQFEIKGDPTQKLAAAVADKFTLVEEATEKKGYILEVKDGAEVSKPGILLTKTVKEMGLKEKVSVDYMDGLSPKGKRFLVVLAVLIFLFVLEPIPLEITAICIGVSLAGLGIVELRDAWAPYMHPVVVFIMCCLIFAIAMQKAGITNRLGRFVVKKAGTSVVRFTFFISIALGWASGLMHDAAAVAVGLVTMIPLMKAAGIKPLSKTGVFMTISLPFACSAGGMGTLVGGGRNMVAAAFLYEFTGIELTFFDWIKFALPAAIITVPLSVFVVWLVFRPDPTIKLPAFDEEAGPWSSQEKWTAGIIGVTFLFWLTKGFHGLDYSITGMIGVTALVLANILKWDDIHEHLEWGTALFIFGGGISLGLGMGHSGAATYFANLFFPLIQGGGWLVLFIGVGFFGAIVTNAMANVAAAALILPIVIPMAILEGVDPRVMALCLGMATSFAMLLVIGCPPNAIAYSYRYFKSSDLTKVGLVATPVLLAALVLVAGVWWKILGLV